MCLFQFDYKLNVGTSHFTLDKGASATPPEPAAAASPGGRNYKNCHTPSWGQQLASSDGVKISSDDTRHLSTNISISDPVREEHNVSSSRTDNTQHQLAQRVLSPMGTVGSQLCRSSRRETQIVRLIIT